MGKSSESEFQCAITRMSAHASQAFSIAHCTDSEDLLGKMIEWLRSFLTGRLQQVLHDCCPSDVGKLFMYTAFV